MGGQDSQPGNPAEGHASVQTEAPAAAEKREQVAAVAEGSRARLDSLKNTINDQLEAFVRLVSSRSSDFQGSDPSQGNIEELRANSIFQIIYNGFRKFIEENKTNAPENLQKAWMAAASEFLASRIASFSGVFEIESMSPLDAQQAVDDLQNQIGPFEKWVTSSPHAAEYNAWKAEQTQAAEIQKKYEGHKGEVQAKLAQEKSRFGATAEYPGLKTRFQTLEKSLAEADTDEKVHAVEEQIAGLEQIYQQLQKLIEKANAAAPHFEAAQNFLPEALAQELETLRKDIPEFSGGDSAALEKRVDDLVLKAAPYEALKPLAEDNSIQPELRNQITESVKSGAKTPEQAKTELESAKAAAEKAALGENDENVSFIDKAIGWVDSMKDGGLKSTLKLAINKIMPFLVGTAITWPFIGDFIKEHLSPKTRAAYGDTEAQKTLAMHKSLRENGIKLPVSLIDAFTAQTAKEVTELIRGNKIETNDTVKAELAKLAGHIETNGGATSEIGFSDFMNNHPVRMSQASPAATPAAAQIPQEASQEKTLNQLFAGLTPDRRAAVENAKAKEFAGGQLPDLVKNDPIASKISTKLKENGAAETTVDPNQTVKSYVEAHLDKNWQVA